MSTSRPAHFLVATDLTFITSDGPEQYARDVTVYGKVYRTMDPDYYAWLRTRMEKAKAAYEKGRLDDTAFQILRTRFNEVHDITLALFGESNLLHAMEHFDPKSYEPPGHTRTSERTEADDSAITPGSKVSRQPARKATPDRSEHAYPEEPDPDLSFFQPVRRSALEKVQAIEKEALTAGWTHPELYQNQGRYRFPYGAHDYGIVCFIDPDQNLGRVTTGKIEVICRGGHSLYFRRRPEAKQASHTQPDTQTKEHAES